MMQNIQPYSTKGELREIGSYWFQLRPEDEYTIHLSPYENRLTLRLEDDEKGEKPETTVSSRGGKELLFSFSKIKSRANWGTQAPYKVGSFQEDGKTIEIWLSYLVIPWVVGAHFSIALYTRIVEESAGNDV